MTKLELHQKKVVERVVARCQNQNGLFLYHHMGTGKTLTALSIFLNFPKDECIVFCPKDILFVWEEEIIKHNFHQRMKEIRQESEINNKGRIQIKSHKALDDADIKNKIVVIDEAHHVINAMRSTKDPKYAMMLLQKLKQPKKIILLSGTPISKDISDFPFFINIAAQKEILPFTKADFRNQFMHVPPIKSAIFGYLLPFMNKYSFPFLITSMFLNKKIQIPIVVIAKLANIADVYTSETLYELDSKKLIKFVSPFVDFHKPSSHYFGIKNFPSFSTSKQIVHYNSLQINEWIKLVHGINESKKLDKSEAEDQKVFEFSKDEYLDVGRIIGNLEFEIEGQLIIPPKFKKLIQFIQRKRVIDPIKNSFQTLHVVYSNFYQKGILKIATFFKEHNIVYKIFEPSFEDAKKRSILNDFRNGKIEVLLLHPDIKEGISILSTTYLHILEPIINYNDYNQVIGRVVRHDSHMHLPIKKQHVYVVNWICSNSGFLQYLWTQIEQTKIWKNYFSHSVMYKIKPIFEYNTSADQIVYQNIFNIDHGKKMLERTLEKSQNDVNLMGRLCHNSDDRKKCEITTFVDIGNC